MEYQRSFHIFYIPLIPLEKSQELICPHCKTCYPVELLQVPQAKDPAAQSKAPPQATGASGLSDENLELKASPWWVVSGVILTIILICSWVWVAAQA